MALPGDVGLEAVDRLYLTDDFPEFVLAYYTRIIPPSPTTSVCGFSGGVPSRS